MDLSLDLATVECSFPSCWDIVWTRQWYPGDKSFRHLRSSSDEKAPILRIRNLLTWYSMPFLNIWFFQKQRTSSNPVSGLCIITQTIHSLSAIYRAYLLNYSVSTGILINVESATTLGDDMGDHDCPQKMSPLVDPPGKFPGSVGEP